MKATDKAKVMQALASVITAEPTSWAVVIKAVEATGVRVKDWREVRNFLSEMIAARQIQELPSMLAEAWVTYGAPVLTTRTTAQALAAELAKAGYKVGNVSEPTDTIPGRVDVTDGVYVEVSITFLNLYYRAEQGEWEQYHFADEMVFPIEICESLEWLVERYPQHADVSAA